MDPAQLTDDELDALAQQLAGRLPTGTHGDRVILSRRQFAAASAGVLSTGALMALGVDAASAQAAGQIGTSSERVDIFANEIDALTFTPDQLGTTSDRTDVYANTLDATSLQFDQVGSSSDRVDVFANTVNTGKADIDGETFIKANRSSAIAGAASGTWHDIADSEIEDNLGEQDSSFNINPDETGWYQIQIRVLIGSAASGDELILGVRNVDTSSIVSNGVHQWFTASGNDGRAAVVTVFLSSGTNYRVQIINKDSSFDLRGVASAVGYTVTREVVHP
jgi:hypothetical protein